jgi:hypothetical protein
LSLSNLGGRHVQRAWQAENDAEMSEGSLDEEQGELLLQIQARKAAMIEEHRVNKRAHGGNSVIPRSRRPGRAVEDLEASLGERGLSAGAAVARVRSASAARTGRNRERSRPAARGGDAEMADAVDQKRQHSSRSRSLSRGTQRLPAYDFTYNYHNYYAGAYNIGLYHPDLCVADMFADPPVYARCKHGPAVV